VQTSTLKGATLAWYGDELREHVRRQYVKRIYEAAEAVRQATQRNLSVPGGPAGPSAPGNYPRADTMNLMRSIASEVDENRLWFRVGSALKYALWLEYGTAGGRTITAKNGGVLSWRDPRTGKVVFAKSVRQGPIAPRPFLRTTMSEMRPWLQAHFEKTIPDMPIRFSIMRA